MRRIQNKYLPLYLSAAAILLLLCMFFALTEAGAGWSAAEKALIRGEGVMRVLTIDVREDSLFLRTPCKDLTRKQILSKEYATLAERMTVTVTSPEQDGVGIAGPQVGVGRRVVASASTSPESPSKCIPISVSPPGVASRNRVLRAACQSPAGVARSFAGRT